jgi:hypothetical protein
MKASATFILPLIGAGSVNGNTSLGNCKMDMKPAYSATSLLRGYFSLNLLVFCLKVPAKVFGWSLLIQLPLRIFYNTKFCRCFVYILQKTGNLSSQVGTS